MEFLLELLLELLFGVLQIIFEAGGEELLGKMIPGTKGYHPVAGTVGITLIATLLGFVSLAVWPGFFIKQKTWQIVYLFFAPLFFGIVLSWRGQQRIAKGETAFHLHRFINGLLFIFIISLIRIVYVK